jgi:spermidine synthase
MKRLFWVSLLGLFLELMLIRWVSTEIRIFAYLQNTVLVVCFLGMGMGCFVADAEANLDDAVPPLVLIALLLSLPASRTALGTITNLLSVLPDFVIWNSSAVDRGSEALRMLAAGLVLTLGVMGLVWYAFVPFGRVIGHALATAADPIRAYSVNVAGSLAGVWLFVVLSALSTPPWVWLALCAALFLALDEGTWRGRAVRGAALGAVVAAAALGTGGEGALATVWSPYQKLELTESAKPSPAGRYVIHVNSVIYQGMQDLSEAATRAHPEIFPPELAGHSQYDLPFMFHAKPRRVLLVGAGSGNDAAGALRHGVERVVAVEIDPAIIALGRRFHPSRPYESPAAHVVNDDARSYFATATETFDVISFGLLDSHTTGAITNTRLDHYVYTRESLARARGLLAPGGVMTLTFEAQTTYIADRIARTLAEVFGTRPLIFRVPVTGYGWGGVMMVAGDIPALQAQLARQPRLAALIRRWQAESPLALPGNTPPATDDWPYLYLEAARVPALHLLLSVLLVALFALGCARLRVRPRLAPDELKVQAHFFFLGAAFLLLEVQNVSKACVVLGSTWQVNAVIISAVLAMVLAANLIAARFPGLPLAPVYALLGASCAGLYAFDLARLAFLPYALKATLLGALTCLPMLFAGIVFTRSFAAAEARDAALGANLLGSLAGGLLQALTYATGIRALTLVVLALYALAFLTRPR